MLSLPNDPTPADSEIRATAEPPLHSFRGWKRFLLLLLVAPIGVVLLSAIALYLPPVQRALVGYVARMAKEKAGIALSVGELRVRFPLQLALHEVQAINAEGDTLLQVGSLAATVPVLPLFNGQIEVPHLKGEGISFFFPDSARTSIISGGGKRLEAGNIFVSLADGTIDVTSLLLQGGSFGFMTVATVKKERKENPKWNIAVHRADLADMTVDIKMPLDSLFVHVHIKDGALDKTTYDIHKLRLMIDQVDAEATELVYARDLTPPHTPYVDYAHLYGSDVSIKGRRLVQEGSMVRAEVDHLSLKEHSGAYIKALSGSYFMQGGVIEIEDVKLATSQSKAKGSLRLPLTLFTQQDSAALISADLRGSIHLEDIYYFTRIKLAEMLQLPAAVGNTALDLDLRAEGTLQHFVIDKAKLHWPHLLSLQIKGEALSLHKPKALRGKAFIDCEAGYYAASLLRLADEDLAQRVHLPASTTLKGKATFAPYRYALEANLTPHDKNAFTVSAHYAPYKKEYQLSAHAQAFALGAFLPKDSLGELSFALRAEGKGFDFLDSTTRAEVDLSLNHLEYKGHGLDSVRVQATLREGHLHASAKSQNEAADVMATVDGRVQNRSLEGNLAFRVDTLRLHDLGFAETPLSLAVALSGEFATNLKDRHDLFVEANRIHVSSGGDTYAYPEATVKALLTPDTTQAIVASGDFFVDVSAASSVAALTESSQKIVEIASRVLSDTIHPETLAEIIEALPPLGADLSTGSNNPVADILRRRKIYFSSANLFLSNRPESGLDLEASVKDFRQDTLKIDNLYASLSSEVGKRNTSLAATVYDGLKGFTWQDAQPIRTSTPSQGVRDDMYLRLDVKVDKNRYRQQTPFSFALHAISDLRTLDLSASYSQNNSVEYALDAILFKNTHGIGLTLKPNPVIVHGYPLRPSSNNAIFYNINTQNLHANLQLNSSALAEIKLYSQPQEASPYDDLNLQIRRLQLGYISDLFRMESLRGLLFTDISIARDATSGYPNVVGDVSINDLAYSSSYLGHFSSALFYQPRNKSSYYLTTQVNYNGDLVLSAEGIYTPEHKSSQLDLKTMIAHFPLSLANPFIGVENATLEGVVDGAFTAKGMLADLNIDGSLAPQKAAAFLPLVGMKFFIDTPPLLFKESALLFQNFTLQPEGNNNPVVMQGALTLLGQEALTANLRVQGKEVKLIDSEPKRGQLLYGKLVTSANVTVQGHLTRPIVRGDVVLHGDTNLTYVYSRGPASAKDNMKGVVEFAYFDEIETLQEGEQKPLSLGGMDVALNLQVDPAVDIGVDLSPDHQDHVYVTGGGNLRFVYPPFGEMSLTGRYNIENGEVNYAFPVVGRKMFAIEPSSYLSWSGNVMNPYIGFRATQKVRANVVEGGTPRTVLFDVSIGAKEQLESIKLAFDLNAPEDLSIQNQLTAMNAEERGKQAVALMVSGSFLASESSQTSPQQLLSGLAVSELNSITEKFLQGTSLNVGMELHDAAETGAVYTDYVYSFRKRLFNDRLSVSLGGKVSSGNIPTNYEQTFIDNVGIEYRIDKRGTKYLKGFHKRNSDNLLEGLVTETGMGFLLRKKFETLEELFRSASRPSPATPLSATPIATTPTQPKPTDEKK